MKDSSNLALHGQVKVMGYLSGGKGNWKSGSLVVERKGDTSYLNLVFNCGGNRSYLLNSKTFKKAICRENAVFIDIKESTHSGDFVSISLRPGDQFKSMVKNLERTLADIVKCDLKTDSMMSKSEVGLGKLSEASPNKTSQFTAMGNSAIENSPNQFTSVKSVKREDFSDEKENMALNMENSTSGQYLQRSQDKSRQCLTSLSFYGKSSDSGNSSPIFKTSTPARPWMNTKRGPGLMSDPIPNKRPRLLSDSISYSMKPKLTTSTENNQSQALQGFSNLGNTCYMNAILQSLFGLDTFATDLYTNKKLFRGMHQQSLYCAMVKLLHVRRQNNTSDIARKDCLRRVKAAISNTAKRFLGYGQHDAHEFLCQVLDQLKEEVLKLSKSTPTPDKENEAEKAEASLEKDVTKDFLASLRNPITVNFEFEVLHTLTCLQCGEQVSKTETFHDISLDVPRQKDLLTPRSLQDALSMFFRNEQIEYTCEKCGHNKTEVTHKITRLPRVFILHLKRYVYSQTFAKNRKMGQNVSVPTYLTFDLHCCENTQPAFPPVMQTSEKNSKSDLSLNDSREDNPSRRKLEYPGYRFKSANKAAETVTKDEADGDSLFTETKPKAVEDERLKGVETIPPRVITLEDEDDQEMAMAIELSLREQEQKDQLCQYYGDDSESNFERIMELSRQEQHSEQTPKKKMEDLTFDEQLELAIQQSLMETTHTRFDDVIESGDHRYTQTGDVVRSRVNNDEGYSESSENYDIGPGGDAHSIKANGNSKTYVRKRSNSDSAIVTSSIESGKFEDDDIFTSKESLPSYPEAIGEPHGNVGTKDVSERSDKSAQFSSEDASSVSDGSELLCLENMPDDEEIKLNNKASVGKSTFVLTNEKGQNEHSDSDSERFGFNLDSSDKLEGYTNEKTDIKKRKNSDKSDVGKDKSTSSEQCTCNVCELCKRNRSSKRGSAFGKNHFKQQQSEILFDQMREKEKLKQNEELSKSDNLSKISVKEPKGERNNEKENIARRRSNSLNETGKSKDKSLEESFMEEDDGWLSLIDDKENKIPAGTPKLSDPSEFDLDSKDIDEVDGSVGQEDLDLPVIDNEKGDLPYSYRLVSIVNHMGVSSSTGHYISDVYDMKKKSWYSFDDSHVTKLPEVDVRTKRERSGYIFFYMSKDIFDDLALQNAVTTTAK